MCAGSQLGTSPLEGDIATVEATGATATPEEVGRALRAALAEAHGIAFTGGDASPAERARADELGARYTDPAFLRRR